MITSKISSTEQNKLLQRKNVKKIILSTVDINLDTNKKIIKNLSLTQQSQSYNQSTIGDENYMNEQTTNSYEKQTKDKNFIFNPLSSARIMYQNITKSPSPIQYEDQQNKSYDKIQNFVTQSMLKSIKINNSSKHNDLNQIIYVLNKTNKGQRDILFLNEQVNYLQKFFDFATIQEKYVQHFYDNIEYNFVQKGKPLFDIGQSSDSFYLILEGEAYYLIQPHGNNWNQLKDANILGKYLHLSITKTLKKYDFVGDYDLLKKQKRQGACIAKTNCHTIKVPKQIFDNISKGYLEQYYNFIMKLFNSSQLFKQIKKSQLYNILSCFSFIEYKQNQYIYFQGSGDKFIYILVSGSVELKKNKDNEIEDQFEREISYNVKENQFFGEESIFSETKQYDSVCTSQQSLLIYIDKNRLESIIEENTQDFHKRIKQYSVTNNNNQWGQNLVDNQEQYSLTNEQSMCDLSLQQQNNLTRRPLSSVYGNLAIQSARSNYSTRNKQKLARCLSQQSDRQDNDQQQWNSKNNFNNKYINVDLNLENWRKMSIQYNQNSNIQDRSLSLSSHTLNSYVNDLNINLNTQEKTVKRNNKVRRLSNNVDDVSQFEDKTIRDNLQCSNLFQLYQQRKKELFSRVNCSTISDSLSDIQLEIKNSARASDNLLQSKIRQFSSLFGSTTQKSKQYSSIQCNSPLKNEIILKYQKIPTNQQFISKSETKQKRNLSLQDDQSINGQVYFPIKNSIPQFQSIYQNSPPNSKQNTLHQNGKIETNKNHNKQRIYTPKNPMYCTIHKEKIVYSNNQRYNRNQNNDNF